MNCTMVLTRMTRSCSVSMSVGGSALGSNLLTSHTSISATRGKLGWQRKGKCHTKLTHRSHFTCLKFSRDTSLGYPRARIISVRDLRSRNDMMIVLPKVLLLFYSYHKIITSTSDMVRFARNAGSLCAMWRSSFQAFSSISVTNGGSLVLSVSPMKLT